MNVKWTNDWEQRKLGEFGKATGGTSIESEFVEEGNYKVISIGSYSETSKYNDQGLRTNKTSKTESKILNKDDLTMILNDKTAAGNIIGRVLLVDADNSYVYNQRTERIEVYKKKFEPSFLYQLLNAENIRSKIIKASQGNTQIYVNWSTISELKYPIPRVKSEQKKIATFFNNLDNLITLHQWKCYFYEIIRLNDWEQRKLGDIVDVCSGRDYKHLEEGNIPVYGTGGYMLSVNEALSDDEDAIGIGRKGTIDNPYILRAPFWTVDTLFYAVPRKNYDLEFVFSIFQNINWKAKDESTGVPSLSKTTINAVKTMISDYAEQKKIGQYFSELDRLITLHQRKYILYKNIKSDTEKQRKLCESEENLRQRH